MDKVETEVTKNTTDSLFEQSVRAGKRTYFFDVKATKGQDYFLTITESLKRYKEDGTHYYQKHKIFLYKEDFDKFDDALKLSLEKIDELRTADERH